jgi:ABC-type oligopeptide transport system substrate-binding subunit
MLLVLTLVMSACGENTVATPTATIASASPSISTTRTGQTVTGVTATTTLATTATAVPTPTSSPNVKEADQVLTIIGGEVTTLDPALASEASTTFIIRQLFSGLVNINKDLKVVPELAIALPNTSADGTTYTFTLRQGAKFHSGAEINAESVKYSWERATDPKLAAPSASSSLPAATYMNDIAGIKEKLEGKTTEIEGVKVLDRYTLQVKTDGPRPYFLAKMTYNCFMVVNRAAPPSGLDKVDGSGPFRMVEFRKDQSLKMARNTNYVNGPPNLAQVNMLLGASANDPLTLYEQGKIDYAFTGGTVVERALDKSNPLNKELVVKPQLDLRYLGFNNRLKPFDDLKIRQAFSLVIDRSRIARVMFENKVVKADTILPPGLPGYTGNPGPLTYDVNRARDLIAQSSYRSPQNLPKITLYSTDSQLAGLFQQVYQQAFGIELEVRQPDYKDFETGLSSNRFQMYIYGWIADYPDPENFLRALLGNGSAFNDSGYNNPQFDEIMKQADQLSDPQKRLDEYARAEQIALTDAPILPIYHNVSYLLVKPYVKGLELSGAGILSLKEVFIVK